MSGFYLALKKSLLTRSRVGWLIAGLLSLLLGTLCLGLTVLAVNVVGDGLRDTLDPKFNKRGEKR